MIDSRLARLDQHWVRVGAEDHVPNWEHRGIVGVPVIRIDRVVNAMEFRCDEDSVNKGRDAEGDVGVSQRSNQNFRGSGRRSLLTRSVVLTALGAFATMPYRY